MEAKDGKLLQQCDRDPYNEYYNKYGISVM